MEIKVNKITKIFDNHYCMILDSPTIGILDKILDRSYRYVWGINYQKFGCTWNKESLKLFDKDNEIDESLELFDKNIEVYVRNMNMDFLMRTSDFLERLPLITNNLHIVQINKIPPYFLDLNRLHGKLKYDLLLKETDYLFEIDLSYSTSVADYTEIISPNMDFLNKIKML